MAHRFVAALELGNEDPLPQLHEVRFFSPDLAASDERTARYLEFSIVLFPTTLTKQAMGFWMDSGAGMTTRHAEFCLAHVDYLVSDSSDPAFKTPAPAKFPDDLVPETRFQHGLGDMRDVQSRIAQLTTSERGELQPVKAEDVLVFPTGMNAIFTASEALAALSPQSAVVAYG